MTALPRPSAPVPTLRNLPAPAKINLFLHVVGQRPDGYHLLQSAFALLHWHDLIHLHLRQDGAVQHRRAVPGLPPDDLCVRAARALQQATGCRLGADIELEKTLPTQAGLGGGSSNAATCLMGLNHLWQLGRGVAKLVKAPDFDSSIARVRVLPPLPLSKLCDVRAHHIADSGMRGFPFLPCHP
jgi:hypothetical protein